MIGKFYPPHRGHKFLIDSATAKVDKLFVIVCHRAGEKPDGELRASWLREIHPGVEVLLVTDNGFDADDSALWARLTRGWLGFIPDLVFTSEDYGDRFAECLGARHECIDKARKTASISGSRIRARPLAHWEYLEPCVRGYYARRVSIVGAESTGKTTLAENLAAHYQTNWVREYGREVSERMLAQHGAYQWRTSDFVEIARTQCRCEDEAACHSNQLLICDTDAFATGIWHERYVGYRSPEVDLIASTRRRPDLYLLSDFHLPFIQDGTRDGESIREWMHERFVSSLTLQQRPFAFLSGSYEDRYRQAVSAIDVLLSDQ
ncbi:MAG TPA: AAA family ATPase [Pyrinomonadaceae bacterium]|nr:AAA family ATPase [Pyrinomonadaceae bacterium]